jgi:IS5 family transposase
MAKQKGLFDEDFRLEKISEHGDPLEKLDKYIDWEIFRTYLKKCFKKEAKGPGGRPPFDYIMMFKILILQRLYNLSDSQMQFQIMDRLSFMRFLKLKLNDVIPDEKTIWYFREQLSTKGRIEYLFIRFNGFLEKKGVIAHTGNIIDASFVEVPKQRNSHDDNKKIKEGEIPEGWSENKKRQKDVNACWTIKNKTKHFGYKNHVKSCKKTKLIKKYKVTSAEVHDSQMLVKLLDKKDSHHELYADSAYSGNPIKEELKKRNIKSRIHEKGYRGRPLTEKQQENNKRKSKIRARVEHIFGFIHNSMDGGLIRSIGIRRAEVMIGLINLVYNLNRYVQLQHA